MKTCFLLVALLLAGCASHETFPSMPFTFIGVPEKLSADTYMNVHGPERSLVVHVLEVKKGYYGRSEVAFGFPASATSPLEAGRKYRIDAAWGRHGMLLLDAKPLEEPNQTLETTRLLAPRIWTLGFRSTVRFHSKKTGDRAPRVSHL